MFVCLFVCFVSKDLANSETDMFFLYSVAFHRFGEVYNFLGRVQPPSQEKSPTVKITTPIFLLFSFKPKYPHLKCP